MSSKVPCSRLACEHHGTKAGRIWRHEIKDLGDSRVYVPVRCRRCSEIITFDELWHLPRCPVCGLVFPDPRPSPSEEPKPRKEQAGLWLKYRDLIYEVMAA